ncbi:ATP-binding protein [Sphaerisporangium sp. NPDC049002]|uniref:ATP-binding protein n=1 Tax=Sphaerisporangium sp. NPDC049002 TaxID=3155392 RepID=UPI00340F7D6A
MLDEVVLLVSELVTNSVTHSDSRGGGQVTLAVSDVDDTVHVEVVDSGSDSEPRVHDEPYGEGGRGLFLVDAISERWGIYRDGAGRVVWFALRFREPGSMNAVPGADPEVRLMRVQPGAGGSAGPGAQPRPTPAPHPPPATRVGTARVGSPGAPPTWVPGGLSTKRTNAHRTPVPTRHEREALP